MSQPPSTTESRKTVELYRGGVARQRPEDACQERPATGHSAKANARAPRLAGQGEDKGHRISSRWCCRRPESSGSGSGSWNWKRGAEASPRESSPQPQPSPLPLDSPSSLGIGINPLPLVPHHQHTRAAPPSDPLPRAAAQPIFLLGHRPHRTPRTCTGTCFRRPGKLALQPPASSCLHRYMRSI